MQNELEESHRFRTLAAFAELYLRDTAGVMNDLERYFKVKLNACKCGREGSGVGLCSLVKPGPNSSKGDTES